MVKKHKKHIFWKNVKNWFWPYGAGYVHNRHQTLFLSKGVPKLSPKQFWVDFRPKPWIYDKKPKVPSCKNWNSRDCPVLWGFWPKMKTMKMTKKLVCNKWCRICIYPTCNTFFVQRGPWTLSEKNLSWFKEHFYLLIILILLIDWSI